MISKLTSGGAEIEEHLRAHDIEPTRDVLRMVRTGLHSLGWDFDQLQHFMGLPLPRVGHDG